MQKWMCKLEDNVSVRVSLLACLLCMAACAGTERINTAAGPAMAPKIVFESLSQDFGTVQPGKLLKHSFMFKNQGTVNLVIEKVKAG